MNISNLPYFDRNTTNIIKGIALIMMFIHHFYTFPKRWVDGISYPLIEKWSRYFHAPFKLCVPIFCFITGYFYFFNKNKSYKYTLKKITDIYVAYWCVFFILAIIAIVCRDYQYTLGSFILECFALYRPTMFHCWYVTFYIAFMLIFPIIIKIMSKNIYFDLVITCIIIPLLITCVNHFVNSAIANKVLSDLCGWFPIVLTGYVFANYNLFERIYDLNTQIIKSKVLNIIFYLIIALVVPMGRLAIPKITITFDRLYSFYVRMDVFYAPIFIYAVVNLCKGINLKHIELVLAQIGKYSLLMWFFSCVFDNNCKSIFQPILYYPQNPIIVTIWGLILCFVPSYILDIGVKKIQNIKNKIFV